MGGQQNNVLVGERLPALRVCELIAPTRFDGQLYRLLNLILDLTAACCTACYLKKKARRGLRALKGYRQL